ncbi:hypothetical protein [Streptomyces sp. NPDC002588]|uniref:hypothetical protein n=1 Tax=Streptomyces sp. NPDC002588 TaxID=3154419 RepID=UPI003330653F
MELPEDDQARAAELPGVALSDSEVLRFRSIVADMVHPLPTFDVRQIEDPDKPGQGLLITFQQETRDKDLLVFPRGAHVRHVMVGSRRLIAHGGREPAKASWIACELHQSGAGAFAAHRASLAPPGQEDETATVSRILDEDLVVDIWCGLRPLARHARDRAAAGGPATVSATICPVAPELPAELWHPRGHGDFGGQLGTHQTTETPRVTSVLDIDDLAENGSALIAATSAIRHRRPHPALELRRRRRTRQPNQMFKRQMFGRAGFQLLRKRVLLA